MSVTTRTLLSYAFMSRNLWAWLEDHGHEHDIMIDSGAHSAHWSGNEINLDEYCDFLLELGGQVTRYVQLDVIGDSKGTRRNLDYMRDRGLDPMAVLTIDMHEDEAVDLVRDSQRKELCIAGGASNIAGTDAKMANGQTWYDNRVRLVRRAVGPDVWLHGLGFTRSLQRIAQLPLNSCDSSSHTHAARSGLVYLWAPHKLKYEPLYLKYGSQPPKSNKDFERYLRNWGRVSPWVKERLLRYGLNRENLEARSGHRGHWSLIHAVSHYAFLEASLALKEMTGQTLYLAENAMQLFLTLGCCSTLPESTDAQAALLAGRALNEEYKKRGPLYQAGRKRKEVRFRGK